MLKDLESSACALGDANDTTDLRPNVMFVEAGGASTGHYYASVRMSPIPHVGERVRLCGNISTGVIMPDDNAPPPGRRLSSSAVLTGTVEAIEWTLRGQPDDVRVEVELRDVVESDD